MASNDNYEEKPNLRPTKRQTAGGKTIFLHHNPNHPSNKSYIHAVWSENSSSKQDPFGIEQPHVEYSLNKQQRWDVLNNFRQHITNQSNSSSDDELDTKSDSEQQQQQKKKKIRHRKRDLNTNQTKYRLYEFHNVHKQVDCVSIISNTGQKRIQTPKKTYMRGPSHRPHEENHVDNDGSRRNDTADVSYYAVVPPPKEKQLSNIRKQHSTKGIHIYFINIYSMLFTFIAKKVTGSTQRSKFTQVKERMNAAEQLEDENEQTSTDDDDLIQYVNIYLIYFC
jgi:hypothetical protein